MKTKASITAIINRSNIPAKLVRAVVSQSGGWESFKEHAPDVANHGASGGFPGWTYYTETGAFTRRNRALIVELCETMAKDLGESGPVALVQGFNCLKDATEGEVALTLYGKGNGDAQVTNALAWFALEEVARAYVDLIEG